MTDDEARAKHKVLRRIANDIRLRQGEFVRLSPAQYSALLVGFAGFILGVWLSWYPFALAAVGAVVGYRRTKHKTWDQRLFDQLASYDPVDVTAYREIQRMAAAGSSIPDYLVFDWVATERQAVIAATDRQPGAVETARDRFVSKPLATPSAEEGSDGGMPGSAGAMPNDEEISRIPDHGELRPLPSSSAVTEPPALRRGGRRVVLDGPDAAGRR